MKEHSNQVVRAAEVIGRAVIDSHTEKVGQIEELVLDKNSGKVRYVVLSSGGFLHMGSDFYAIPWAELNYCSEKKAFRMTIAKDILKTAPGFNKYNWPDFANSLWSKPVDDWYRL